MKDQASLNLLIVNSPIDSKALTGHLMLRATSSGLKVYDATGSETELGGGGISEITVGEGLSGTGTASNPLNPSASDAYLYVDEVQDPYNEDGTSKSWTNMTGSGTITVLHNRMS